MSPLQERRFAHEPVYCQHKGKIKVYCRCGVQSRKFPSMDEAVKAYVTHVGLKEMERKEVLH